MAVHWVSAHHITWHDRACGRAQRSLPTTNIVCRAEGNSRGGARQDTNRHGVRRRTMRLSPDEPAGSGAGRSRTARNTRRASKSRRGAVARGGQGVALSHRNREPMHQRVWWAGAIRSRGVGTVRSLGKLVSLPHGLECDETPARQDVARLIGASEQRCRTVRQTWRARYG